MSSERPRLLDLGCGAGGATRGYQDLGWRVTGVDINPQPNYCGDYFAQADALTFVAEHGRKFDAIHASMPCQAFSSMCRCRPELAAKYPDLVTPIRPLLDATGRPWVMENVPEAPMRADVTLCGHMFGLALYRHRIFESNVPLTQPAHPKHVTPGSAAGHWLPGRIISVSGHCSPMWLAREAMGGIGWMNRHELAESIPPAFAASVGLDLLRAIRVAA